MNTRFLARAATPARALRAVGAPSSFRVIAVPPPHAVPSHSAQSSLAASSSRAFATSAPALKKAAKTKKGGKKGKDVVEEEDDDELVKNKGKGKKGKKGKKEDEGEEDKGLTPEEIDAVEVKTKAKMDKAVDWARGVVYEGVQRGLGHVSPAILDNIKVTTDSGTVSLKSVASVTAKQNTLFVDVWDADTAKAVSSAIHSANLPGMSPQQDGNSIRIPVSRPTSEVRQSILKNLHETIEAAKNQVRVARSDSLKALGGRGEDGTDAVQKLADAATAELEKSMQLAKKELEK
ncbi:hypothetical protein CcaverHIS002_0211460 [Cutaneotrichosporon cavernicola]|uniref:Ribosome recycling factor domain-containing protein n=1 Tax=Cutaneotrichosporon cavernicola TaxID=279322 RepID=A0AA48I231_9TREE|nr:uncharacterized protein CcaverHIS019_0211460 [Cutaneotrichosporon cavernicola]BEI81986.1 hypothetical protein CcaverHIS002_0211460 [Cutaneotrichosporon cavernicola]BEI89784.1 hypothetical protein CcaverHIS019_0211460 [Cutaneotrichosporon cavernicola]BEI97555.1 hypothetical protein CcaverHIS631_0211440 [Cutaneotrichosporon cavernicola]BEJ05334.1 hypothetical protein CcaverHIS641_0211510 [Cutaneotrichosporon cavernicola]